MAGLMKVVTDSNFEAEVLKASTLVLVDFWAEWCPPCLAINPTLEALAAEFQGKLVVVKINVEENTDVPATYGARSLPFLTVFKNGKAVSSLVGAHSKARIKEMIEKALTA